MPTEVVTSAGNTITLSVNKNVLTTINTETSSVSVTKPAPASTIVSGTRVQTPISVLPAPKNKLSVIESVLPGLTVKPPAKTSITISTKGPKGDPGPPGEPGAPGADGGGLESLFSDSSPKLGAPLDVTTFGLFASAGEDIRFTPVGTGKINLDGTVKFKRFDDAPIAFEGGMYADKNDNLYFGVDDDEV